MSKRKSVNNEESIASETMIVSQIQLAADHIGKNLTGFLQLATFLSVANVTVVGYAISNKISGIILVGALLPICIVVCSYIITSSLLPSVYCAVSLEHKYSGAKFDWLNTTCSNSLIGITFTEELRRVSLIENETERFEELKKVKVPLLLRRQGYWIPAICFLFVVLQVSLAFILHKYFEWNFF